MLEGYKILRAVQESAGAPFTVGEISSSTGVNEATVRTVLMRERGLLEELGRIDTGRRGAKPKRYQLRSEAMAGLDHRLAAIDALAWTGPNDEQEEQALPSGLVAAEETLLALGARDSERLAHEASIGWLGFDAGQRALQACPEDERADLAKHLAIVKGLLGLGELEHANADGEPIDEEQIEAARRLFAEVPALDVEPELQAALEARLQQSPVGDRLAPAVVDVMFAGAATDEVEEVVRLLTDQQLVVQLMYLMSAPLLPRRRAQFGVLVLGGGGETEDVRLEALGQDEPVIVVGALGNRPELARRLSARRQPVLHLSGLPELATAVSFVRGVGDSWLPVGQRLFAG
jgi:hypothetical protein